MFNVPENLQNKPVQISEASDCPVPGQLSNLLLGSLLTCCVFTACLLNYMTQLRRNIVCGSHYFT